MRTLTIFSKKSAILGGLAALGLSAAAFAGGCTVEENDPICIAACPAPLTITVRGTPTMGAPDVSTGGSHGNCWVSPDEEYTSVCAVGEDAGDYRVTLNAPGYESKTVLANVDTSNEPCECGYEAKEIDVTLEEAPITF